MKITAICIMILFVFYVFAASNVQAKDMELLNNGGFENGFPPWKSFSYSTSTSLNATVTDLRSHSGAYSLHTRTGSGTGGAGGGAYQYVQLDEISDLKLTFWVILAGTSGENSATDIASITKFSNNHGESRFLIYYVAWSESVPIFSDFPAPVYSSKEVTNLLIADMERDKWTYVECDLEDDFRDAYPDLDIGTFTELEITLISVCFMGSGATIWAGWDDVSLTAKHVLEQTSSPTSIPTTATTTTQPSSPTSETIAPEETIEEPTYSPSTTASTEVRTPSAGTEQWLGPILLIVVIITIISVFLLRKRSATRAETYNPVPSSRTKVTPTEKKVNEYCYYCGATMPSGSSFCKKCGKPQS